MHCALHQVEELSQGLVLVTNKMNERLMATESGLKEMRSSKGPAAKVCACKLVLVKARHVMNAGGDGNRW